MLVQNALAFELLLACLYCLVINVHRRRLRQLYYIIMCCFSCQQLFSTFFDFLFALSKKALKIHPVFVDLLLPCSATLDTIHPAPDKSQHYFSNFFQNGKINKIHNFLFRNCGFCTNTIYLIIQLQLLLCELFLLYR